MARSTAIVAQLMKTGQVASLLGISRFQVLRLIKGGHLPAQRVGRDHWIRRDDVEAFVANGSSRDARITERWVGATARGARLMAAGLLTIPRDVPPRRAITLMNLDVSAQLTSEQDREFREALAEVLSASDPAGTMLAGFMEVRPRLAGALAQRDGRREPTFADFAAANVQMLIMDRWAIALREAGFRRRSVDVIRGLMNGH